MARLSVLIASGEVCCCLRAKQLFYDTDDHDRVDAHHSEEVSGPFWCTLTQSVLGPDGKVADVESCRGDRGCCKMA